MPTRQFLRRPLLALVVALLLVAPGTLPAAAAVPAAPPSQAGDGSIRNLIESIRNAAPDIEDTFETDTGRWDTGYTGDTSTYFKAGRLHLSVDVENLVSWSEGSTVATDFYAEVDTIHREGALNNQFGLIFRYVDTENFYFFSVGSDGYFALQALVEDEWETLIEWTTSGAIEVGEGSENTLGVLVEGPVITLLINDEIVGQVRDETFSQGKLALAAGTYEEPGVDIAFDNFAVWLLGGSQSGRNRLPVQVPDRPEETPEPVETPAPVETPIPEETPAPVETPTPEETPAPVEETPAPVETPEPVTPEPATPEPTVEPIEEPVLEDIEARIAAVTSDEPTYVQDFAEEPESWVPSQFDGTASFVEDEALVLEIEVPNALGWTISNQSPNDFYLEIDATHLAGTEVAEYGVLFRYVDPQNFYFFALSATGEYSLWMLRQNEWQAIQDWTFADTIEVGSGATNRLGILAEGEQIALLVNDTVVYEVADDTFPTGALALALGTFAEADVAVAFDDLELWELSEVGTNLPAPDNPVAPTPVAALPDFADADARIQEIKAGDPIFVDDFRRDQGYWDLTSVDNAVIFYERRALHMQVTADYWIVGIDLLEDDGTPVVLTDFYAETDIHFVTPDDPVAGGLYFRQDGGRYYWYAIDSSGAYALLQMDGDQWNTLIPWTESDLIDLSEDAVNRIGLLAEGETLTLTINGTVADQVDDAESIAGSLGPSMEAYAVPDVEVAFDNFILWDLSQ